LFARKSRLRELMPQLWAFVLRMQALQRAQQSGNNASNSEQAIQFISTHVADSGRAVVARRI
jgi:hypothetical protein